MSECGHTGCRHHTERNRYEQRSLLCRLSIHRHWGDDQGSPPPFGNQCLECGYGWVRRLYASNSTERWAWWLKAPWFIRKPMWWLNFAAYRRPWIPVKARLDRVKEEGAK